MTKIIQIDKDFGLEIKLFPFKFKYRKLIVGYYYDKNNKLRFNKVKCKAKYVYNKNNNTYSVEPVKVVKQDANR